MIVCPKCNKDALVKRGKCVDTRKQRYQCKACGKRTQNPLEAVAPMADGYIVKGQSRLYDADGKVKLTWEKTDRDSQKQIELIQELAKDLAKDVKPVKAVTAPKHCNSDLMTIIPIGDAHIGMLAWQEETGASYDLEIAEDLHKRAVTQLIEASPNAETCVIIDVGDFIHADNLMGTTTRSGHNLDMDGRYHKIIRVCFRIVRYYISQALTKFQKVIYRPEIGNHNDIGAIWLQESLSNLYENEPRVTVANNAGNRFYWQHGLCFFGCHHGHEIKMGTLPDVMATHVMNLGIKTKFRKWFTGHIHHESKKDFNSCSVQSYRTLASLDAYAASHGYNAPRDISLEVWHKTVGEISTHRVNVEMLETEKS